MSEKDNEKDKANKNKLNERWGLSLSLVADQVRRSLNITVHHKVGQKNSEKVHHNFFAHRQLMIIHKNIIACIACLFGFSLLTSGPIYAYEQAYRNYATQFNQAIAAYRQADYPTAFDFFSRSAQEGHKRGQFMLGVLYLTGLGTAKDPTQGYAWLNVAAQSGNLQWMSIRDSIELMLNAEQIEQGKIETVQLKQRFGMKAQNIACFQQAGKTLGINHIHCQKKQYRSYDAQMSSAWQIISQSQ